MGNVHNMRKPDVNWGRKQGTASLSGHLSFSPGLANLMYYFIIIFFWCVILSKSLVAPFFNFLFSFLVSLKTQPLMSLLPGSLPWLQPGLNTLVGHVHLLHAPTEDSCTTAPWPCLSKWTGYSWWQELCFAGGSLACGPGSSIPKVC